MLSILFAVSISLDPLITLLSLKLTILSHSQFKLLQQITMAAKQTIANVWKSQNRVLTETKYRINQAITQDKISDFKRIWLPWVAHYLPSNFDEALLMPS